MRLLLDMGNSRLKSAVLSDAGELCQYVSTAYNSHKPIETLAKHLSGYYAIQSATIVSVLGSEFQGQVVSLFRQLNTPLRWVESEAKANGVVNRYDPPQQLGSDRFVALVAARHAFPAQCCIVIDCGTAVTVDALSDSGEFWGGVIIPGLRLWSNSLIKGAGQLNEYQIDDTSLFSRNTAQAIGSGSIFGLTSAIEGICNKMTSEIQQLSQGNNSLKLVICGGDAEIICDYSQLKFELIPHLVLMGLAEYT